MFQFIRNAGPWGTLLSLLALLNFALLVWTIVTLYGGKTFSATKVKQLLESFRHVGKISIVAGVLGQLNGIYLALGAIRAATDISPVVIFDGAMVSFTSTIMGLTIGLITYICYAILTVLATRQAE